MFGKRSETAGFADIIGFRVKFVSKIEARRSRMVLLFRIKTGFRFRKLDECFFGSFQGLYSSSSMVFCHSWFW